MELYHWCACKLEELQKYFEHPNPINCRNGYSDIDYMPSSVIIEDVGDSLKILVTFGADAYIQNLSPASYICLLPKYSVSNIDVAYREYPMNKNHCKHCESILIECIENCDTTFCMSTCKRDYATCLENCV